MSRDLARDLGDPQSNPENESTVAVVALGSNLGDRGTILAAAARDIARLPLVDQVTMSEPVESVALRLDGLDPDAPAYLNAVALVSTRLAPSVLLGFLHAIEASHGRERRTRWGDRTLDLDLIAFGDVISDDPDLLLPHPRAAERDFVLGPWLAVDPDAQLPGRGAVRTLLDELQRETLLDDEDSGAADEGGERDDHEGGGA